jgi:hypothetical protein
MYTGAALKLKCMMIIPLECAVMYALSCMKVAKGLCSHTFASSANLVLQLYHNIIVSTSFSLVIVLTKGNFIFIQILVP